MADLFILLTATAEGSPLFAWRQGGAWKFANERPSNRFGDGEHAVAFVPGTMVTTHRADILARRSAEIRRTALFALEDDLAQPVEQMHVALGPVETGASRLIHVASLEDMQQWTETLARNGLNEADLVASHAVLPADNMCVDGGEELLFREEGMTFACDSGAPDDLVRSLAPDRPQTVLGQPLARRLGVPTAIEFPQERTHLLGQLAEWYSEGTPSAFVSLRQGDFAVKRSLELKGLDRWRVAGALAGAALVVWLGSMWLEAAALKDQAAELRARTGTIVSNFVPSANGNVSAAKASMRDTQRAASTALRPTIAAAALYEALSPTPDAEIRSLRYDANTGRLVALVVFDSYSQADAIGERLEQKGLSVALGEARQSGLRVLGEFTIEASS